MRLCWIFIALFNANKIKYSEPFKSNMRLGYTFVIQDVFWVSILDNFFEKIKRFFKLQVSYKVEFLKLYYKMLFQCISQWAFQDKQRKTERSVGKSLWDISLAILKQVLTYFKTNISFIVNEFWHVHDYGYILSENGLARGWESSEILTTSDILTTPFVR